ncbi:MAG: diacylglycerol kinase family lipid kinase [Clostridia bacterium]|nr:diacylglycerol kinase family lipid kinase [Clostridia bacterium]
MLDFIINPLAGGKKGKKIKNAIAVIEQTLKTASVSYSLHYTEYPKHATELTRQLIKNGATDIVVVGGDGSLHEVLNGFSDFDKVALGLIPCGTGNDFASAIGIPEDPEKALDIILKGKPQFTDFMQMPTVRGMNIIGMGLDVDVLHRYEKAKKKTKLTYTLCLIKSLMNFEYSDFDIKTSDGKCEHYRSIIACIANGHRYGGGIEICPPAKAFDNALDFVAMKEMKRIKLIGAFMKLKKGKILTLPQAVHFNTTDITITPKGDYTVNVDGQLYENIPFGVKVVPNTLRMYR